MRSFSKKATALFLMGASLTNAVRIESQSSLQTNQDPSCAFVLDEARQTLEDIIQCQATGGCGFGGSAFGNPFGYGPNVMPTYYGDNGLNLYSDLTSSSSDFGPMGETEFYTGEAAFQDGNANIQDLINSISNGAEGSSYTEAPSDTSDVIAQLSGTAPVTENVSVEGAIATVEAAVEANANAEQAVNTAVEAAVEAATNGELNVAQTETVAEAVSEAAVNSEGQLTPASVENIVVASAEADLSGAQIEQVVASAEATAEAASVAQDSDATTEQVAAAAVESATGGQLSDAQTAQVTEAVTEAITNSEVTGEAHLTEAAVENIVATAEDAGLTEAQVESVVATADATAAASAANVETTEAAIVAGPVVEADLGVPVTEASLASDISDAPAVIGSNTPQLLQAVEFKKRVSPTLAVQGRNNKLRLTHTF